MNKPVKYILIAFVIGIMIYVGTILFNQRQDINNEVNIIPNAVQLIILPEYDEYLFNQDVWVECKIINNTTKNYSLEEYVNWNSLNFKLTDPEGKIFGYKDNGDYAGKPKPVILAPGEVFETVIHMGWHFASRTMEEREMEGVFEINAKYQDLISNTVHIYFTSPEEADKSLYEKTMKVAISPITPSISNELQKSLEEYPTSKFTPQLYGRLLSGMRDSSSYFYNFNMYLNNCKNSFETYFIIGNFKEYLSGELKWSLNDVEKEIQKIISNNKGTKIETAIQYLKNNDELYNKMRWGK